MDKPVIFLAFANNQDDYLPMLNLERKNIYRSLRLFNDNGVIKVETEATSSLEDIFETFINYDNQIQLFHYGGHAGTSHLLLETLGKNEAVSASGLADLLGRQQNLKLVFLNGCATKAQVDFLLKAGVKAVIATSVSVQDKMAMEFAELFYNALAGHSTIERAFHIAKAFINSRYQNLDAIKISRDFVFEGDTGNSGEFPWGLYLNQDADDVLNWTLPFPETTYQASNTQNLLNRVPSSTTTFVGYEKEMEEFGKALLDFPLIAIEGLGGVGKTEFAIEAINRFINERERIIWVSPITRFDVMVQQSGYEEILLTDNPDEVLKFKSLEGLLDRDNRVVFIEDFHDNNDPTFLRFFEQLSISRARIVIVTRFLIEEIEPGVAIQLGGLGSDAITHARNLRARKAAYEDIPDDELVTLCRLTEGHPLSMELGMQLLGYGESADDVLEAISGGEYMGHKKVEDLSQRLLRSVLNHPNTSAKEKDLLLKFSVFQSRVPLEAIQALVDNPRIKYPLSQLIEKSLIRHRDKLYDSPPLVREFCRVMLEDKEDIHALAADYFMDERTGEFDIQLEEDIIYHLSESNQWELLGTNIKNHGRFFIAHGQTQLLQAIINKLIENRVDQPVFDLFRAEIFNLKGEFKKAMRPIYKALKVYRSTNDLSGVAHALNVLGELHMGTSNFEEAREVMEEALDISLDIRVPSVAIASYEYLALIYINQGKIEAALDLVQQGLELANELDDQYGIASLLNVEGKIFAIRKDYEKALASRRKSFKIFSTIGARTYMVVVANNIAVILNSLGRYEEALIALEKALEIENEIGAKYRIGNLYHNIGKTLLRMNKKEEALRYIDKSLQIHNAINHFFGEAAAFHARGVCLEHMDKNQEAIQSYEASLKISDSIGYHLGMLNNFKALGNAHSKLLKENEACTAIEWYIRALALSHQLKIPDQQIQQQLIQLKEQFGESTFRQKVQDVTEKLPNKLTASLNLSEI